MTNRTRQTKRVVSVVAVGNFNALAEEILRSSFRNMGIESTIFFTELTAEALAKTGELSKKDFLFLDHECFCQTEKLAIKALTDAQIRVATDSNKRIVLPHGVRQIFIDYELYAIIGEVVETKCL